MYWEDYFNNISLKWKNILEKYIEFFNDSGIIMKNKKILDIWCWDGEFLRMLDESNVKYWIEISDYALAQLKSIDNVRTFKADLGTLTICEALRDEKFDIITLFDVIEHIQNFEYIHHIVKNNLEKWGLFVISTPNANSLLRFIRWNNKYSGESDPSHQFLFTPYTLDFFLRRIGLEKVKAITPYLIYFKNNFFTQHILLGWQIFAIYKK
jgi:2-polyprenyl-3-methyl-5-hydroxy-6-metoxy-1,4-benzoquinol methylase